MYTSHFDQKNEFPNYFQIIIDSYAVEQREEVKQKIKVLIEQQLDSLLTRLQVYYVDDSGKLSTEGYFKKISEKMEAALRQVSGSEKYRLQVYLAGGVVRTLLAHIYAQLHSHMEASKASKILQFSETADVAPRLNTVEEILKILTTLSVDKVKGSFVLGVGSDIDVFYELTCLGEQKSDHEQAMHKAIQKAGEGFLNSAENFLGLRKYEKTFKKTLLPPADVKEYVAQTMEAMSQGGSALDWLAFRLNPSSKEEARIVEPPPELIKKAGLSGSILENFIEGKYEYIAAHKESQRPYGPKQTIRGLRPLLEIPFLSIKDETIILQELERIAAKDQTIKVILDEKAYEQIDKMRRNAHFEGGHNRAHREQKNSPLSKFLEISRELLIEQNSRIRVQLPKYVQGAYINEAKFAVDLFSLQDEFEKDRKFFDFVARNAKFDKDRTSSALEHSVVSSVAYMGAFDEFVSEKVLGQIGDSLIEIDQFIETYTDRGTVYHGTAFDAMLSVVRGGFFISDANQGTAIYGSGLYTSANREIALGYANSETVLSLSISRNKETRIIDLAQLSVWDLCLMSEVTQDRVLKPGKMYFEKKGAQLQYTVLDLAGKKMTGLLDINVEEALSKEFLNSKKSEILEITSKRGQTPFLMSLLQTEAREANVDLNELLRTKYNIDIIINQHILIQNAKALEPIRLANIVESNGFHFVKNYMENGLVVADATKAMTAFRDYAALSVISGYLLHEADYLPKGIIIKSEEALNQNNDAVEVSRIQATKFLTYDNIYLTSTEYAINNLFNVINMINQEKIFDNGFLVFLGDCISNVLSTEQMGPNIINNCKEVLKALILYANSDDLIDRALNKIKDKLQSTTPKIAKQFFELMFNKETISIDKTLYFIAKIKDEALQTEFLSHAGCSQEVLEPYKRMRALLMSDIYKDYKAEFFGNINMQDREGVTALMHLCASSNPNWEELDAVGTISNWDLSNQNGKTALLMAIENETIPDDRIIALIQKNKVDLNYVFKDEPSIILAIANKRDALVVWIVSNHKADLRVKQHGLDILLLICQHGLTKSLTYLIANNIAEFDLNGENNTDKKTPLMLACQAGQMDIVNILLAMKPAPDLNRQDRNENTAFMLAIQNGKFDIVKRLLACTPAPDCSIKNQHGETAFSLCVKAGKFALALEVLKHTQQVLDASGVLLEAVYQAKIEKTEGDIAYDVFKEMINKGYPDAKGKTLGLASSAGAIDDIATLMDSNHYSDDVVSGAFQASWVSQVNNTILYYLNHCFNKLTSKVLKEVFLDAVLKEHTEVLEAVFNNMKTHRLSLTNEILGQAVANAALAGKENCAISVLRHFNGRSIYVDCMVYSGAIGSQKISGSLLIYACYAKMPTLAIALLDKGFNPNEKNSSGMNGISSPLMYAGLQGLEAVVDKLIEKGAVPNEVYQSPSRDGFVQDTLLLRMLRDGNMSIALKLIEAGAQHLDWQYLYGEGYHPYHAHDALQIACREGKLALATLIVAKLQHGRETQDYKTPYSLTKGYNLTLKCACLSGNLALINLIIANFNGSQEESWNDYIGITDIIKERMGPKKRSETIIYLLDKGMKWEAKEDSPDSTDNRNRVYRMCVDPSKGINADIMIKMLDTYSNLRPKEDVDTVNLLEALYEIITTYVRYDHSNGSAEQRSEEYKAKFLGLLDKGYLKLSVIKKLSEQENSVQVCKSALTELVSKTTGSLQ